MNVRAHTSDFVSTCEKSYHWAGNDGSTFGRHGPEELELEDRATPRDLAR
jgi:hypothetical protein